MKITWGQGNKYKLEAFAKPIYATQYELVWTVEDSEGVVAFDKDTQVVKGLKIGKATITVALKNDPSKTSSCEIIVISPAVATIGFDFEPAEFEIEHGGTLDLFSHIKFNPSAATDRYMDWESEKPSVVSVRGGRVTGLEATTEGVLITAKLHSDNSKVATCRVKVKQPTRPQNIKMLTSHLRIKVGDVRTLAVEFFPETSSERKLIWTSNNTTIATVDAMGTVTAKEKGFTVVTAMLESDPRIMTVCTVEVVDPSTAGLVTSIAVEDVDLMVGKTAELSVRYTPADAVETEKMVFAAAEYKGPVYVRLGRLNIPVLFDENYKFEIGKAATLREGNDVAILATGLMVSEALEAAKLLEEKGIKARVVNVSTIKPLDTETVLKAAKECKFIVTSEEHSVIGGLGSAVSEYLSEVHPAKVVKHGIQDVFGQSADGETMLTNYGLRAKDIAEIVLKNL